jgi:alanine dehydrogenase
MIALMDGRYITEARTAAVSAVSVKCMSLPDARVLAIIGSGVQARSHLEAIRHVRTLSEVRVWSPSAMHREQFALEMTTPLLPVFPVESAADAVHRADIVVLATASASPVIASTDINAGTHIAAVGACRADQREMPSALVARARVVVDSRAGARKEAGDLIIPIAEGAIRESHVVGELGEVVLEQVPGRLAHTDVTVFKSLGMAVEDIVAAHLVLRRAREARIGQRFSFS